MSWFNKSRKAAEDERYMPPDYSFTYDPSAVPPEKKTGRTALKVMAVIAAVSLALFAASLAVVVPKQNGLVLELGEELTVLPADYLYGYSFIVDRAEIDLSGVDSSKVGEYSFSLKLLFYDYSVSVRVEDTTPPELIPLDEPLFLATGQEYFPENFAKAAEDISGEVKLSVNYGGSRRDSISFPKAGSYNITLEGEDPSGNIGTLTVEFTVDDPPVIIGVFDRHLPVGTDFDPANVIAVDSVEGVISDRVSVDTGGFDPGREGSYSVTYTARDSHNLETVRTVTLTVCRKQELK